MRKAIVSATIGSLLFLTAHASAVVPVTSLGASEDSGAVKPLDNAFCRALAPQGWSVIDEDDRGATYTVASPDRSMVATYGIAGISSAQVAGYDGPQYRRPALFAQFLAETVAG